MEMIEFLSKYKISVESFKSTGLEWDNLIQIYNNHNKVFDELEIVAESIAKSLRKIKDVHSVKYRIKDSEHLIEKIIRKKIEDPTIEINIHNYKDIITDLIGIRALHLYKNDWEHIHEFITEKWKTKETPTANIRVGDPQASFESHQLEIKLHKYGYRSIHYIIITTPYREDIYAEIQVRTIFEEGWSEIDHNVRYPYDKDNPILLPYLYIFNSLAGSADEMGTYIKFLMNEISKINGKHEQELKDKDSLIEDLKNRIDKLVKDETAKQEIKKKIDSFKLSTYESPISSYNPYLSSTKISADGLVITSYNPALSDIKIYTDESGNPLSNIINSAPISSGYKISSDGILTDGSGNPLSNIINSDSTSSDIKLTIDVSASNKKKEEHKKEKKIR